jgi:hypothetical protein
VIEQPQPNDRAAYRREWMRARRERAKIERIPSVAPTFTPGMHRGTDVGIRFGDADWDIGGTHPRTYGATFIPSDRDPAYPDSYKYQMSDPPTPAELAHYRAAYLSHPKPLETLCGPRWSGCELRDGKMVPVNSPREQALN